MIRTYRYGAKPPTHNAELVRQQLILASRYQNALVEIEHKRREAIAPVLEVRRRAMCAASQKAPPLTVEQQKTIDVAGEAAKAAWKEAQHASTLYWGTYLCVNDAMLRAKQAVDPPKFRSFDGQGLLAVQCQKGLPVVELLQNEDTRVRLVGEGKHRVLWLRVGSEGIKPVWAHFPIVYHRPLPPHASIAWVRVTTRRTGTKIKYAAQFVLTGMCLGSTLPPSAKGAVAIDVGWRKRGDEVRVATWADDSGASGQLLIPVRLLSRYEKTEDLRSIRDKSFNAALRDLLSARDTFPSWLLEATRHAHAWQSPQRLAGLIWRWRKEAPEFLPPLLTRLEAWRKQDKHLYEWECHQRQNVLAARRDLYRCFAKQMAQYKRITVEKLDLRDFAELPSGDDEPNTHTQHNARGTRFKAALSELFSCMADAAQRSGSDWGEAPPAWTTQTCHACREREEFDAALEVVHMCSHCGAAWDQDVNAAKNLLRAAECGEVTLTRSRMKPIVAAGDSAVAKRRREGKLKKKAAVLEVVG